MIVIIKYYRHLLSINSSWVIRSVTRNRRVELFWIDRRWLENRDIIVSTKKQQSLEGTLVSSQAIREYLLLLWEKYQGSSRHEKGRILDELERNLGMHRKAAIRMLRGVTAPRSKQGFKGGRRRRYSEPAKTHLAKLWRLMGYMCSVRMKAALPEWIEFYSANGFDQDMKREILAMSESSIKRFLINARRDLDRRRNTGTRRAPSKILTLVPIRPLGEPPTELGHCEIDCVAHCGGSLSGEFVWTLTLTDIVSGWTECEAMWGKTGAAVKKALEAIEKRLPFALKALYSDNGCEFLNRDIIEKFCRDGRVEQLPYFRGRPYKKNDQAYVEQKNYTHVRSLFGYGRLDWKKSVSMMNNLYRKEWRLLQNFFMPQQRLLSKFRVGSRVVRKMSTPITPIKRLHGRLHSEAFEKLANYKSNLDPIRLRSRQIKKAGIVFGYYKGDISVRERGKLTV